jgi:hypothetical protein
VAGAIFSGFAMVVTLAVPARELFGLALRDGRIDPALAENQLIFPNDETLAKVHIFRSLADAEENEFQAAFQSIILG